jgi:glyoxylase-like metal-dependent hydrolase (beta-lactamase superfamily II)
VRPTAATQRAVQCQPVGLVGLPRLRLTCLSLGWLPLVFAFVLLAACASPGPGAEVTAAPVEVAPGVYMLRGTGGEVEPGNLGRIGNAGFIVGSSGVLVIDTGISHRHGQALLQAIERTTDKPVRAVLITQTRQEFLFGATAFQQRGIPVHMHVRAAGLMTARCESCLKTLRQVLGDEEMQGTALFRPDLQFDRSYTLDPALIGRPVQVLHLGHSSGPGDVVVFDVLSGVLFGGGLLEQLRVPDVQDSDLPGWQAALAALRSLPLQQIVPGHGPVAGRQLVDETSRYLAQLNERMITLMRQGAALSEVADAAELPEFRHWDQYDVIHRRNASVVYLRLEREMLFR